MLTHRQVAPKAKQARAQKTEQSLLDALERLLAKKSFAEMTVSELAQEAGVTTGAIYRRFANKEDVLRAAFRRFQERPRLVHTTERPKDLSDFELIEGYLTHLMDFTFSNVHIMQAANGLNDIESFDHMNRGRSMGADWLAQHISTSKLSDDVLRQRIRFVLRVATATFRETFFSGHGAAAIKKADRAEQERKLARLCANLASMAVSYLELADQPQGSSSAFSWTDE